MAAHVLVVDDDAAERNYLEEILNRQGYSVECAAGGEAALARLAKAEARPISAMILDLVMPEHDGMCVLERLQKEMRPVPVIVQTAAGGIDAAMSAIRAGALDFVVKPASAERLRASIQNALKVFALEDEIRRIRLARSGGGELGAFVIRSSAMQRARRLADRAARLTGPVLIEGETATGKETLARAIHAASARGNQPFVALRTARLPATEIERALFGAPGSRQAGGLAAASRGTLFVDDIGALPPGAQIRLAESFSSSADSRKGPVLSRDVRLIASTDRRLIELVADSNFDAALFNQLNVHPIWMPPLRYRRADIPELASSFVARLAAETGVRGIFGLSPAAMELLTLHDWPGNIREFEQTLLRAVVLCPGGDLLPAHFPTLSRCNAGPQEQELPPKSANAGVALPKQSGGHPNAPAGAVADRVPYARYGVTRLLDERGEMRPIGALEEEVIRFAIDHYRGRMSEVARRLGIGRSTLYRKIRDYGIAAGEPSVS